MHVNLVQIPKGCSSSFTGFHGPHMKPFVPIYCMVKCKGPFGKKRRRNFTCKKLSWFPSNLNLAFGLKPSNLEEKYSSDLSNILLKPLDGNLYDQGCSIGLSQIQ